MEPVSVNLMDSLKEAIRERHARMESLPFIAALTSGKLPLESYVGQLRAMAAIQGTLEHELSLSDAEEIKTVRQYRPSRLVHLRRDLSVFDAFVVPESTLVLEQTRSIAAQIHRLALEQPRDLLGILYVLEGMTLGNAVHLPDVLNSFSARTSEAAHYYAGYGDKTDEYWQEFACLMNAISIDQADCNHLIQVANDFFDQLETLFRALYPFQEAPHEFTVNMLNPGAGSHAIPDNAREIQAAIRAARRCCEEFPYFDERYQERGRSFAMSDAAWLVTLTELPEPQLMCQVEWLGRVLANRGIPRITLERQLELLYEELTAAVSTKSGQHEGLLKAAASLKEERMRMIPESKFNELAQQFHIATDGELQGRLKGTGALIVSAVVDEAVGMSRAVSSLLSWLTDAERFSSAWIAAVDKTAEWARKGLHGNQ